MFGAWTRAGLFLDKRHLAQQSPLFSSRETYGALLRDAAHVMGGQRSLVLSPREACGRTSIHYVRMYCCD